ncbi:MAG: translation initiation factor IF-2, partial [Candidatus Dadabacteria bacterium]|nr:translation initiation factor IF-2 [Candidatus Dadabacteria bacterium]NIQ16371.1 translation initiation factor IF-2 [Candidatus Dadabacteria bacterium]
KVEEQVVTGKDLSDVVAETDGKIEEQAPKVEPTDEIVKAEAEKSPEKAKEDDKEVKAKVKKKGKKVRPKKEEIIDEDTLEELRKAFRTKLPSRKREYVIDDRRPKLKHNFDNSRKRKTNGRSPAHVTNKIDSDGSSKSTVSTLPPTKKLIKIGESITVGELAKLMSIKAGDVIKKLMLMGNPVTINESIDNETAILIADEYGFEVEVHKYVEEDYLLDDKDTESIELQPRPPVVTVMGHVDHGKTTLLDTIREANVVEGEAGGITQHIGAYKVNVDDKVIVFVDTPGHEAFTSMRARGASITDIVILVVAADDGVMPQTVEAVNHAQAAEVPIIVAINKMDKEGADPDRLKRELSEIGLITEEWGGDTLFAEVSAKQKTGIKELLELVLLQSDILELEAPVNIRANGFVVEAGLDKGRGAVSTVIVKEGILKVGDYVLSGVNCGKVRALVDDKGKRIQSAGPSIPVEIMGLSGVPEAGDRFYVVKDEKTARDVIAHREDENRAKDSTSAPKLSLEDLFDSLEKEEAKELNLIIKGDTQGSVEALRESVEKLSTDKCKVKIVHTAVGGINETDVVLASASNAIIVGFNVRPDNNALSIAEKEGVSLELHTIIYDVVNRIRNAMEGLLEPILKENITGHVEVKETFHISRLGTIAGCMVLDGKVNRDDKVRVVREGVVVFDGKVSSLKRFKDDVKEVQTGYECGMSIENFNDIKVGDVFELYSFEEIKQEL